MSGTSNRNGPMRIDFVITELFVGGAERCLTELAIALSMAGDQVRVISLGSLPSGDQGALVQRIQAANVPLESLQCDSIWNYPRALFRLRRRLMDEPADLVQTFLHHANVVGLQAAAAAGIGVRVAGIRVAQRRAFRSRIERVALRRATSVVCVSRGVAQFAQSQLGCSAANTIVIPNGVDVERFANAPPIDWSSLGWPVDSQVSLFLGRLDHQKGLELVQRQIDRIAPPRSPRKLLLVGDGPLRDSLQRWCDRIGSQRVQLLDWQPDPAPILAACRLLVLPSHYEGMPNVILEAMAAGKPVVCSLVEGSEELISGAEPNQGFPPGDSERMAGLIELFQSDEMLCERLGSANQQRVRRQHSLRVMTDAYREHYRTLLTRRLEVS